MKTGSKSWPNCTGTRSVMGGKRCSRWEEEHPIEEQDPPRALMSTGMRPRQLQKTLLPSATTHPTTSWGGGRRGRDGAKSQAANGSPCLLPARGQTWALGLRQSCSSATPGRDRDRERETGGVRSEHLTESKPLDSGRW